MANRQENMYATVKAELTGETLYGDEKGLNPFLR